MKTPYDTALRVADRRLDAVRAEMAKVAGQLRVIEIEEDAAAAALQRECLLAVNDPRLTTERYFIRARDYRAQLLTIRNNTHAHLEDLRRKAVVHYADRIAIDTAMARHREELESSAAAAEQAEADDLTGGRYRRPARRRSTNGVAAQRGRAVAAR